MQYRYEYDKLGQLIREDNRPLNSSYEYIYDNAGNILEKYRYDFTLSTLGSYRDYSQFSYTDPTGWGDLLTGYNGDQIVYDEIGNPIFIGDYEPDYYSGSGYVFEWEGRQLVSMWYCYFSEYGEYYESSEECTFTYNADGIRTSKTTGGEITYEYILNGSQVIGQKWVRRDVEHLMLFVYDETGAPIGIKYRKSTDPAQTFSCYFFEKNLQGDIVAIYDSTGRKIGAYTYDAWGVCASPEVASGVSAFEQILVETYNPFRYRGYFYDVETGYYYLQSRYYNPEWCRFLNADAVENLGANSDLIAFNLFVYCSNNPVNGYDPIGKWTISFGWEFSAFFMGGVSYSFSVAFDSSGNIAIQTSKANIFESSGGSVFGIASAGVGRTISYTSLETVDDLNGEALNTGGSFSVHGISVGGEAIAYPDDPTNVVGGTFSLGVGVGVDYIHTAVTTTKTIAKINVIEKVKNAWNRLVDGIGG